MSLRWRQLLGVLLLLALAAMGTPVGAYLNSYLFLEPAMKLRAAVGLRPGLDPKLKLVLFEDRSLEKIGRAPTFTEWRKIGDLLLEAGFRKVFLVGFGAPDEGTVDATVHRPGFVAGAVVIDQLTNLRAEKLADLPVSLLVPNRTPENAALAEPATWAIVPDPTLLKGVEALGNLNLLSNSEVPSGFQVGSDYVLPNMGLLAGAGLRWEGGHPVDDRGRIPTSNEGNLYVDFVDPVKALANALPVSGFFQSPGYDLVRTNLHPNFKEKLQGGEIAVLVADAFTGSRFVDTPTGKVLSYFAVVSMMNGVLSRSFIYPPFPIWACLLCALPVLFVLLTRTKAKMALTVTAAVAAGWVVTSVLALLAGGWILPSVQVAVGVAAGWLLRLAHHLTVTLGEKLALSREMDMGRAVQQMLLPKARQGRIGPFDYQVLYQPYWSMAGDWFQVFAEAKDGVQRGVIAFGDGVGKGPSAALNTAVIAAAWASARAGWIQGALDSPAFARTVDDLMRSTFAGEQCTTLATVEIEGDAVRIGSCAGQRWLKFSFAKQQVEVLKNPKSDLLGLGVDQTAAEMALQPVTLDPGDFLLGFTDGVFDGSAGLKRFAAIVRDTRPEFDGDDIFSLVSQLATYSGQADVLPDDKTLVMIRRPLASVVGGTVDAVDPDAPGQRHAV